jgi:type I restriction-modification system DNA methylase subunit
MPNGDLNWIANFIWGIADDVLRDVYVRGKYRDVILPLTVIRRLDAVLEPTKQDVLKMSKQLDKAGVANKDAALSQAAGPNANHAFYNDSPFTLRDLQNRARQQQLKAETWKRDKKLHDAAKALRNEIGDDIFQDNNMFRYVVKETFRKLKTKLTAAEQKIILSAVSWRAEDAPPVIKKAYKSGKVDANPLHGLYEVD